MEHDKIIHEIKNKIFKPVYILMGEESYYIDLIANALIEHCLSEDERDFNQFIFYGRDVHVNDLINTARRYPMMSDRQLVVVKEAQDLGKLDELAAYIEHPTNTTVLLLEYRHKSIDKRKRVYKSALKQGLVFESKSIYSNKLPEWIVNYLSERKIKINHKAAFLIAESLGANLSKISNELNKALVGMKQGESELTLKHIEQNIGISKDFNNFELTNALMCKDVKKANQIINYFISNPKNHPVVVTMITLFNFFSNLLVYYYIPNKQDRQAVAATLNINPYFVKDYANAALQYSPKKLIEVIADIRNYDAKCKGVGNVSMPPGELLKELIYKILH